MRKIPRLKKGFAGICTYRWIDIYNTNMKTAPAFIKNFSDSVFFNLAGRYFTYVYEIVNDKKFWKIKNKTKKWCKTVVRWLK